MQPPHTAQNQKKKKLVKIQAEDLNKYFSKKDIQMAKQVHEKIFNTTNY